MLDKLRAFVQFVHGLGRSDEGVVQDDQGSIGHLDKLDGICPECGKRLWTFGQMDWTLCPFVQSDMESVIMDFWPEVRFNGPS